MIIIVAYTCISRIIERENNVHKAMASNLLLYKMGNFSYFSRRECYYLLGIASCLLFLAMPSKIIVRGHHRGDQ